MKQSLIKNTINYLKLILVIIIVVLLTKTNKNKIKKNNLEQFTNKIINPNRHIPSHKKVHYLYWTGGFDSTFRLCEMLINEKKIVQPIYVALVLDNDCQSEETCNKLWLRRNRNEEKLAMKNIINKLKEKFPNLKDNILPVITVNEPISDDVFNYNYEKLFYSKNLWPKKRKKHQYLFLSKYAFYYKTNIDIGVLGIHEKSKLARFLRINLHKINDNVIEPSSINYKIQIKNHPLTYLQFPLFGRTKADLLEKAKKYDYDDILKITWSCWFPNHGKPCNKCPMCKERIVEHPDNKT